MEGESPLARSIIQEFDRRSFRFAVLPKEYLDVQHFVDLDQYWSDLRPNFVIDTSRIDIEFRSLIPEAVKAKLYALAVSLNSVYLYFSPADLIYPAMGAGKRFDEKAEPKPMGETGKLLLQQEQDIKAISRSIVLRLSWLMGQDGDNLFTRTCENLVGEQGFDVSDTAFGSPLTYEEVVRILIGLIQQVACGADNWGIFHLCSSDSCSEAEFVDCIARLLTAEGVDVATYNVETKSGPKLMDSEACLLGKRLANDFGVQLGSWRKGLKRYVQSWLREAHDATKMMDNAVSGKELPAGESS